MTAITEAIWFGWYCDECVVGGEEATRQDCEARAVEHDRVYHGLKTALSLVANPVIAEMPCVVCAGDRQRPIRHRTSGRVPCHYPTLNEGDEDDDER